jgi:hypothetical protein
VGTGADKVQQHWYFNNLKDDTLLMYTPKQTGYIEGISRDPNLKIGLRRVDDDVMEVDEIDSPEKRKFMGENQ